MTEGHTLGYTFCDEASGIGRITDTVTTTEQDAGGLLEVTRRSVYAVAGSAGALVIGNDELGRDISRKQPRTSISDDGHRKHPYLLRKLSINRPNQVWCTDITYAPMPTCAR